MEKNIYGRIRNKIDTTTNWESLNPTLLKGEIVVEETSDGDRRIKIGDGTTAWNDLNYFTPEVDLTSYATKEYVDNLMIVSTDTEV